MKKYLVTFITSLSLSSIFAIPNHYSAPTSGIEVQQSLPGYTFPPNVPVIITDDQDPNHKLYCKPGMIANVVLTVSDSDSPLFGIILKGNDGFYDSGVITKLYDAVSVPFTGNTPEYLNVYVTNKDKEPVFAHFDLFCLFNPSLKFN